MMSSDPERLMGAPLRRLDAEGRRLLRLQAAHGRGHGNRPSARVVGGDGERARVHKRAIPLLLDKLGALGINPETCAMDKGYDIERVHL